MIAQFLFSAQTHLFPANQTTAAQILQIPVDHYLHVYWQLVGMGVVLLLSWLVQRFLHVLRFMFGSRCDVNILKIWWKIWILVVLVGNVFHIRVLVLMHQPARFWRQCFALMGAAQRCRHYARHILGVELGWFNVPLGNVLAIYRIANVMELPIRLDVLMAPVSQMHCCALWYSISSLKMN